MIAVLFSSKYAFAFFKIPLYTFPEPPQLHVSTVPSMQILHVQKAYNRSLKH